MGFLRYSCFNWCISIWKASSYIYLTFLFILNLHSNWLGDIDLVHHHLNLWSVNMMFLSYFYTVQVVDISSKGFLVFFYFWWIVDLIREIFHVILELFGQARFMGCYYLGIIFFLFRDNLLVWCMGIFESIENRLIEIIISMNCLSDST